MPSPRGLLPKIGARDLPAIEERLHELVDPRAHLDLTEVRGQTTARILVPCGANKEVAA